ncbi:MAG: nucleotide pyrophosphohydrolase [Chromatiales bacterium 21-64-14]|nr:MAG: nucleotide pyrophosphohydrolase [Chromatiales bacterium 21-64-14]HQU16466.1 nucleotide pyrophosphohydrolase [Gammaproteobacteria bacterium]
MAVDELHVLAERLRQFAAERDWERFHSPKNLAMALIVEAAELVEHFQWLSQQESAELPVHKREEVELEMADILIYLVRLADRLGVNLLDAARRKIDINESRYPAQQVRGSARKYTEY